MYDLLEGLRIVEGSAFVAAPLGGMTLGQLGADVIRFDALEGGLDYRRWPVTEKGDSIYWAGLNKGKRSFRVDIRSPRGRELVQALIAAPGPEGGLFLTNLPARGWLGYETLSALRADLILLNVLGTRSGAPQVDYTVNASVGFPFVTGPEGAEGPVNNVLPAWDIATGMTAAAGLLAAERRRTRTGEGRLIRLSLLDVALWATATLGYVGEAVVNGEDRARVGNHIYGTFGRDFRTADGRDVMVCLFTARNLRGIAEAAGLGPAFERIEARRGADLNDEADRWRLREDIAAAIEPWIAARPLAAVAEAFDAHGVLWGPYRTFREMASDPALVEENPLFERIEQPGMGMWPVPGAPLDFVGLARGRPQPAPRLGEHTDEILAGILRLPDAEIGRLHDDGVVKGPDD